MPNEIELKLRIAAADIPHLKRHPAVASIARGKPVTRRLISIYYDTPQLDLLDAGLSLRVRRMSGGWFQAVKAAGHSLAGLHQRMEWEDIIARGEPDFSKIIDPMLTRIFDNSALRSALRPIFTTDVRRTEWQLATPGGNQVEMALDLGTLIAGDARETISEVELELKGGDPAYLFQLALALLDDIPLWIENISKAEHGYAYYRPQPPTIVRAGAVRLHSAMHPVEAGTQILWQCLAQLQGNHEVVMRRQDQEGVHQMRVALRRMRSAMAVFSDAAGENSALLDELRWMTGLLGEARDLDVLLTETLPHAMKDLDHPGLSRLQANAEEARKKTYAALLAALQSPRYQRLLLNAGAWLASLSTRPAHGALPQFAQTTLLRRHRQLCKHGRRLGEMRPDERHAARIAAKKLRYSAEFFSSLYPHGKTRRYLHQLAELQAVLGELNDIAVTDRLIQRLAGSRSRSMPKEAQAAVADWNARRAEPQMVRMDSAWQRFAATRPFWD